MMKYHVHQQFYSLLCLFVFMTSCNGQVKKDLPKEKVSESNILSIGHPKLIKNLGSLTNRIKTTTTNKCFGSVLASWQNIITSIWLCKLKSHIQNIRHDKIPYKICKFAV
jgi:hypothetical protein